MERKVKDFTVIIEQDEDGIYVGKGIQEAIQVCVESEKEEIVPLKFVGIQRVGVMA